MSKELPYFKFFVNEWITGDITLEDYEVQGLFVNICAYYWSKDCEITLANAKRKFKDAKPEAFQSLIDGKIIKVGDGDKLIISFLEEQSIDRENLSKTNSINGKKGGAPNGNSNAKKANDIIKLTAKQPIKENKTTEKQPKTTNIEKRREENIDDVYTTPTTVLPFFTIHQFEKEVEIGKNEFTLHAIRSTKHSEEDLDNFLKEFIIQQKALTKLTWPNISDAKKHFVSWAGKQQKKILNNGMVATPGIRRTLN